MKVFIFLFLNFLLISNLLSQQKVHFSNYIENAFYLNPATSSPLIKQVSLLYKSKWRKKKQKLYIYNLRPLLSLLTSVNINHHLTSAKDDLDTDQSQSEIAQILQKFNVKLFIRIIRIIIFNVQIFFL